MIFSVSHRWGILWEMLWLYLLFFSWSHKMGWVERNMKDHLERCGKRSCHWRLRQKRCWVSQSSPHLLLAVCQRCLLRGWGMYRNVPTDWVFVCFLNLSVFPRTCFSVCSCSFFVPLIIWLWFIILAPHWVIQRFCTHRCIKLVVIIPIFFFLSFRRPILCFFLTNFHNLAIKLCLSGFPWEMLAGHSMKPLFWWKTSSTRSW